MLIQGRSYRLDLNEEALSVLVRLGVEQRRRYVDGLVGEIREAILEAVGHGG